MENELGNCACTKSRHAISKSRLMSIRIITRFFLNWGHALSDLARTNGLSERLHGSI